MQEYMNDILSMCDVPDAYIKANYTNIISIHFNKGTTPQNVACILEDYYACDDE